MTGFDGSDLMAQKNDTALPNTATTNPDTIKLIGMLRATAQVLWKSEFETAFYQARLNSGFLNPLYGTKVWEFSGTQAVEKDLIVDYFANNAVFVPEAQQYQNPVLNAWIVPKTEATFESQFPAPSGATSPAELWTARVAQALQISAEFTTPGQPGIPAPAGTPGASPTHPPCPQPGGHHRGRRRQPLRFCATNPVAISR